jgi:hypothetical protein
LMQVIKWLVNSPKQIESTFQKNKKPLEGNPSKSYFFKPLKP